MTEIVEITVRGGIPGLRRHVKIMPECWVKAKDMIALIDRDLDEITQLTEKALAETEKRSRRDGIIIGIWLMLLAQALVWVAVRLFA